MGVRSATHQAQCVLPARSRVDGVGSADAARYGTPDDAFNWAEDEDLRADAKNRIEHWPVWK